MLNTQSRKAHVLRVAGAQLPVRNDVQKNLGAITRASELAAREKADVLVTPEGSLSGYTHNSNAAATAQALAVIVQCARQAKVVLVLGTCFSATDGARYDAPAILPMNLKMRLLLIKHLRILRFMGAMRAKRFRGSLIMGEMGAPGEGPRPARGRCFVGRVPSPGGDC
ncbi:MAG: nitrilase-related carbon-nitrogen hydrolase [Verrucomicrobiota bacterium]